MNRSLHSGRAAPLTGRSVLIIALAFFGVIVAVNVGLAVVAGVTFPGLVVENSYTASQGYNAILAAARKQDAIGFEATLRSDGDRLVVALDGSSVPLGLTIYANIGRPSTNREDRSLAFIGDGRLYRSTDPLANGLWDVEIEVRKGQSLVLRRSEKITIDGGRNG